MTFALAKCIAIVIALKVVQTGLGLFLSFVMAAPGSLRDYLAQQLKATAAYVACVLLAHYLHA